MPSGSRGSGGGSSGGSGSGGSHFSSSRNSSINSSRTYAVRNGRTVVYINSNKGRRYMSLKLYYLYSFFLLFVVLFIFFGFIMITAIGGINYNLKTIESDYVYYQDMIENADAYQDAGTEGYIIYGRVLDRLKRDDCDKWYLTYSFVADDGNIVDNGYTFSTYDWEDIKDINKGDLIKLALEYSPSDYLTDSIDYNYKNTTLEDDGEYIHLKESKQQVTKIAIICGVLAVVTIGIVVFIKVKSSKKEEFETLQQNTYRKMQQAENKKYCRYCGAHVNSGETSCKNCGAGIYSDIDLE